MNKQKEKKKIIVQESCQMFVILYLAFEYSIVKESF